MDWLESHLDEDGRLPAPLHDLGSYYKWPLALAGLGRPDLARRVFDVIVSDFMTEDGDFRSGDAKSGDPLYDLIAHTYTWPVVAARILDRPDVGQAGLACLRRRRVAVTGGYLTGYPGQHEDQRQDIVTIAGCGNALLAWGAAVEAAEAGDCLLRILAGQVGPADPFYLYTDGDGRLLTELDVPERLYRIDMRQPAQAYVYLGMSSIFLSRLYLVTGEPRFLAGAQGYFAVNQACGDRVYHGNGIGCCKTGWAAAALYRITGEPPYRAAVERAAVRLLEAQAAEGNWPDPTRSDVLNCDVTGEMIYHLTQYCLELGSYRPAQPLAALRWTTANSWPPAATWPPPSATTVGRPTSPPATTSWAPAAVGGPDGCPARHLPIQQCLYFRPLPQGHGSLRPGLDSRLGSAARAGAAPPSS